MSDPLYMYEWTPKPQTPKFKPLLGSCARYKHCLDFGPTTVTTPLLAQERCLKSDAMTDEECK